jgi:hypothetical protein
MNTSTIINLFRDNPLKKQIYINMIKNAIIYVVAILIFSACAKTPKTTANDRSTEKPTLKEFKIGEKWTWKWKRSVEGEIRAEGEVSEEVVEFKGGLGFSGGVNTIKILDILDEKPSSTPFNDWPLKVGKKWKYEESWEGNDGTKGKTSQDAVVISFEEVLVDAGKFMAYKIEYKGRLTNSRGFDGLIEDTWWYAPEIKKYIKHTNFDGQGLYVKELINYINAQ